MEVSFSGLDIQYKRLKPQIHKAIEGVFNNGRFILSDNVKTFETNFAEYCGVKHAVGVASGTEAITLSLLCCGIGQGDEVITVPNTAIPTICAVTAIGAKPVFADVGEDYLIDPGKIKGLITHKTKAVIPVHLYGNVCAMKRIRSIAKKYNLYVIEDAAQAHGARSDGRRAGGFGDLGCFSFYPTKNLGAYGDAGLITTNSGKFYKKLLMLRDYGRRQRNEFVILGINSRLDELHAAVLNVKLKYLDAWTRKRRELASVYNKLLDPNAVKVSEESDNKKGNYHLYVIRVKGRDRMREYLKDNGIQTYVHYPVPAHLQKAFKYLGYKKGDLPKAEAYAKEILSLPLYPELSETKLGYVCKKINRFRAWKKL